MKNNGNINISQNKEKQKHNHRHSIKERLFLFFKWWLVFTGIYSVSSVCPFCGKVGCPVGLGSAGALGAFFALFMQNWKHLLQKIHFLKKEKTEVTKKFEKEKFFAKGGGGYGKEGFDNNRRGSGRS